MTRPETDSPDRSSPEARPRLSRARVLEKALELTDQDGLEALTMRKLAGALGVEAMSLYHHVKNRDALLDGLIDLVYLEMVPPQPGIPWRPALRARARSSREVLLRHPWAVSLLESRRTPGPANLRHHEAVLACLRQSGFSLIATAHAYALLDSFIYGSVVQELQLPFGTAEEAGEVLAGMLEHMPRSAFPYLTEMALEHALKPDYRFADEFDFGLERVLDVLERLRETE